MSDHQFVKLPHAVIDHADLTAHELLIYIALLRYRNPVSGQCFPGMQTIADASRTSISTARKAIKTLEAKGLIEVERVKAVGSKTNASNRYLVGMLPEDPLAYLGHSAKGQRVPKRELSEESRARLSAAARRRGSASEAVPMETGSPGSASEIGGSASEAVRVVPPRHGKKINFEKTKEEDLTRTFGESAFENVSFDLPGDQPATEKQVALLRDLAIIVNYGAGNGIPDDLHVARWRKLNKADAHDLIREYYKAIGRPDAILYPSHGDPEYHALSPAGKDFADSAGDPASVIHYGIKETA